MGTTVITGASSGIGRSLALRIGRAGEPIALLARSREPLERAATEIEAAGGRALAIVCDVTDPEAVAAAVRRAEAALGPVSRLVANAGGAAPTPIDPFEAEHVADVFDLNFMGVVHCIEAVLPGMLERGKGQLVAVSSLAGYRGLPGSAAYSAAKAALTNLMESLRIDLRPRGITVTVVAPGFVENKPGKHSHKPFRVDLESASERIWAAIRSDRGYYAFPRSLVALAWVGRLLPAAWYDRLLAGRGPHPKRKRLAAPRDSSAPSR